LKDVGLAEYNDVFPVRSDIHSFLRENAKEVNLPTCQYNGIFKKTAAGFTLFNALLAGLLL